MNKYTKVFQINQLGRDLVIGDLHGCYDYLRSLLNYLNFDETKDRLFSVGDVEDRGSNSLECVRLLNKPWFHCVKSNHGQMASDYILEHNTLYSFAFLMNGGNWIFKLSETELTEIKDIYAKYNEFPYMITVNKKNGEKFHIIHAEFNSKYETLTDKDLEDEQLFEKFALSIGEDGESILWNRNIGYKIYEKKDLDKIKLFDLPKINTSTIYSGHSPVTRPIQVGNQIFIDTGAFIAYNGDLLYGLTITEPETSKFWTINNEGIKEVELFKYDKDDYNQ